MWSNVKVKFNEERGGCMNKNDGKFVGDYLVREVTKDVIREIIGIIIKFAVAVGLTYLAVRYGIIQTATALFDNVLLIFSRFCIIYFWCSVMHIAVKSCRFIITGLITGTIACVVILILCVGLFPEEIQGFVFIAEMAAAILYDIIRLTKRIRSLSY